MIKEVLIWPNSKLRKKAREVTEFDEKLTQLVIDLHQTMAKFNNKPHLPDAAGLAAPQIGVPLRVFVYKLGKDPTCMINPVIIEQEGEQYEPEGCLSFPGVFIKVKRADKILVEFQDVDGNKNQLKTDGFISRCIQHEIDHLDGTTYLHALSQLKRDLVTRKMKKIKKRLEQQEKQFNEYKRRVQVDMVPQRDSPSVSSGGEESSERTDQGPEGETSGGSGCPECETQEGA